MAKRDLHNILLPKQRKILTQFGEDLLLAMKRRGFTKKLLCERTGFDHKTVNKVFAGDPGVAIGLTMQIDSRSYGAHDRIRTGDLFLTKEVLYLLSYVGQNLEAAG